MNERLDAIGLATAKAATYGGGASAFVFGLSASEFAAVVGAVVALLGWLTQLYFNRRRDRRERDEHAAKMARWVRDLESVWPEAPEE